MIPKNSSSKTFVFTSPTHSLRFGMRNLGTYLLWALAVGTLWHGSLTEDLRSEYVCILNDPDSNQCDSFCLNELRPVLNKVVKGQNQGNSRADRLEAKLELQQKQLQEVQTKLEGQQAVLARIEGQLQEILKKMDAPKETAQQEFTVPFSNRWGSSAKPTLSSFKPEVRPGIDTSYLRPQTININRRKTTQQIP